MVALKWSMKNLYGVDPGETWWCGSDIGWVVGHSYIVYAPLLHGATSILYEGKPVGTPDAGAFWRVIAEHGAVAFFTAPTAFRAIKKEDPQGKLFAQYDLSKFRTLFLAGERADPDTILWAEKLLQKAGDRPLVADRDRLVHRRQSGGPRPASGQARLADGGDAGLRRARGRRRQQGIAARHHGLARHQAAAAAGVPADACGSQDERMKESYLAEFPGYYKTADAGYIDDDGYVYVMGRTDDIINVAGHRLSTGGMEEVLAAHKDVAECAVLGIKDELKGEVPCGFIVLKAGVNRPPGEIEKECVQLVRDKIGPVASFRLAIVVASPAEDALGKNPARHHQEDRRRRHLDHARDDRGPQGARRDRRRAEGQGRRGLASPDSAPSTERPPDIRAPTRLAVRSPGRRPPHSPPELVPKLEQVALRRLQREILTICCKNPIVCPMCEAVFVVPKPASSGRGAASSRCPRVAAAPVGLPPGRIARLPRARTRH